MQRESLVFIPRCALGNEICEIHAQVDGRLIEFYAAEIELREQKEIFHEMLQDFGRPINLRHIMRALFLRPRDAVKDAARIAAQCRERRPEVVRDASEQFLAVALVALAFLARRPQAAPHVVKAPARLTDFIVLRLRTLWNGWHIIVAMLDGRRAPPHDSKRPQDLMRKETRKCHAEQQRREQARAKDGIEQEAPLPLDFALSLRQRRLFDGYIARRIDLDTASLDSVRAIRIGKAAVIPDAPSEQ